jgi:hypothetical protein
MFSRLYAQPGAAPCVARRTMDDLRLVALGRSESTPIGLVQCNLLPPGCRSAAAQLPPGCRSAADRLPLGCRSAADRLPLSCRCGVVGPGLGAIGGGDLGTGGRLGRLHIRVHLWRVPRWIRRLFVVTGARCPLTKPVVTAVELQATTAEPHCSRGAQPGGIASCRSGSIYIYLRASRHSASCVDFLCYYISRILQKSDSLGFLARVPAWRTYRANPRTPYSRA